MQGLHSTLWDHVRQSWWAGGAALCTLVCRIAIISCEAQCSLFDAENSAYYAQHVVWHTMGCPPHCEVHVEAQCNFLVLSPKFLVLRLRVTLCYCHSMCCLLEGITDLSVLQYSPVHPS